MEISLSSVGNINKVVSSKLVVIFVNKSLSSPSSGFPIN